LTKFSEMSTHKIHLKMERIDAIICSIVLFFQLFEASLFNFSLGRLKSGGFTGFSIRLKPVAVVWSCELDPSECVQCRS